MRCLHFKFLLLQGNVDVVKLMIASGARLEAYDVHFGPPLHIACAKEHMDCVKEMLKAGQVKNTHMTYYVRN